MYHNKINSLLSCESLPHIINTMGVSKSFEPSKDCKAVVQVNPKSMGPLHIDASATTYSLFKRLEGRLLLKELKKLAKSNAPSPPPPESLNVARHLAWTGLARILDKIFTKNYSKSKDTIHYDGPPTSQKAYARQKRQQAVSKMMVKLMDHLQQAERRLQELEQSPAPSRKKLSRLTKFLSGTVFPMWTTTRPVDARSTRAIVKELRDSFGWKCHNCPGQFDLCAGRLCRDNPEAHITVVTTDSDLQFVGAHTLLRFKPKGTVFYLYPIKEVIEHCGLESVDEWKAAAVIASTMTRV